LALKIRDKQAYRLTTTFFQLREGGSVYGPTTFPSENVVSSERAAFKVINITIHVFWDITVNSYRCFGGNTLLRNIGNYLPVYKA
jgi:hypothetical protein